MAAICRRVCLERTARRAETAEVESVPASAITPVVNRRNTTGADDRPGSVADSRSQAAEPRSGHSQHRELVRRRRSCASASCAAPPRRSGATRLARRGGPRAPPSTASSAPSPSSSSIATRAWGSRTKARAGTAARLAFPAEVKTVKTRNLWGFIRGRSKELVALTSHSDGSNAIEDNGPGALVASAQYLARLPKDALPRTIMVLLTTGHFAGGSGSIAFCKRQTDLVKRINAAITVEHLGLREWDEVSPGQMGPTGL